MAEYIKADDLLSGDDILNVGRAVYREESFQKQWVRLRSYSAIHVNGFPSLRCDRSLPPFVGVFVDRFWFGKKKKKKKKKKSETLE